MQILAFIGCCLLQNQDGFLVYNLSYLLLYPKFECNYLPSGEHINDDDPAYKDYCNPQYYCANPDKIEIMADMNDSISLKNWMYYQDILCDSSFLVGLFGMLNFIGMC